MGGKGLCLGCVCFWWMPLTKSGWLVGWNQSPCSHFPLPQKKQKHSFFSHPTYQTTCRISCFPTPRNGKWVVGWVNSVLREVVSTQLESGKLQPGSSLERWLEWSFRTPNCRISPIHADLCVFKLKPPAGLEEVWFPSEGRFSMVFIWRFFSSSGIESGLPKKSSAGNSLLVRIGDKKVVDSKTYTLCFKFLFSRNYFQIFRFSSHEITMERMKFPVTL